MPSTRHERSAPKARASTPHPSLLLDVQAQLSLVDVGVGGAAAACGAGPVAGDLAGAGGPPRDAAAQRLEADLAVLLDGEHQAVDPAALLVDLDDVAGLDGGHP